MKALRHLYGPAILVALLLAFVIPTTIAVIGLPGHPTDNTTAVLPGLDSQATALAALRENQLKDYKAALTRLDANVSLQALVVVISVLLVIRRSDSLNLFGNSIPLSWLHLFVPVFMMYLWLSFGFILHDLIWSRIRGVELLGALGRPVSVYQPLWEAHKALYHDASFIDGWFIVFVDPFVRSNYSAISHSFSQSTAFFLVLVLGTLAAAGHACVLAIAAIGSRRYALWGPRSLLRAYYFFPTLLAVLIFMTHLQFAYGGQNRNWLQLYVAVVTIPLTALLLWLSAVIDGKSYIESVRCLLRQRERTYRNSREDSDARADLESPAKTIALIGDSLSTGFHVSSRFDMLLRVWRGWKINWFLSLQNGNVGRSVVERLSTEGTIIAFHHATVSASVDSGGRRNLVDHLIDRWHFSHQVDEVLAGPFPDVLLIWIGHNDVDWASQGKSRTPEILKRLANDFARRYEIQLERIVTAGLAAKKRTVVIVFGLINFDAFFKARAEAEASQAANDAVFPYLEAGYRFFLSMKPASRKGMIELAERCNVKLRGLCRRIGHRLSGTAVTVVYSDAMATAKIGRAKFLCDMDAWHPSLHGHQVLADGAYPEIDQAVRWLEASSHASAGLRRSRLSHMALGRWSSRKHHSRTKLT